MVTSALRGPVDPRGHTCPPPPDRTVRLVARYHPRFPTSTSVEASTSASLLHHVRSSRILQVLCVSIDVHHLGRAPGPRSALSDPGASDPGAPTSSRSLPPDQWGMERRRRRAGALRPGRPTPRSWPQAVSSPKDTRPLRQREAGGLAAGSRPGEIRRADGGCTHPDLLTFANPQSVVAGSAGGQRCTDFRCQLS